ncbi:MAG: cytochrome c peroxidase [Planctomycetota bacterium]
MKQTVSSCVTRLVLWTGGALLAGLAIGPAMGQTLPPPPVPAENPMTEEKRVLGKILFWDEQMSATNSMACGTCHIPSASGSDQRELRGPGADLAFETPDDVFASPGVPRMDAAKNYEVEPNFGVGVQATPRTAPTMINAAYAANLFWDGRAIGEFTDPQTGQVEIVSGGALESQAVGPPLSTREMAHPERDWDMITAKLTDAKPLALATNIPADMQAAIDADPTYPELFEAAFGDGTVTSKRIAFAIATYERTLISDQAPWDLWVSGDDGAMTANQIQGWDAFQASTCSQCHEAPLFTDNEFHNVGTRAVSEDAGREGITGLFGDRGKFKTSTLRNMGLKVSFLHTGELTTMDEIFQFYQAPLHFDNLSNLMPVIVPPPDRGPMTDFLMNALTDPRVANEEFPFDRPTLRSELAANPAVIGMGTPDGTGAVPELAVHTPPLAGTSEFRIGVTNVPDGATVTLLISDTAPVGGVLTPTETVGPLTAAFGDGVAPVATAHWTVPSDESLDGSDIYFQWLVEGTSARSRTARATIFCGTGGCDVACPGDINDDGTVDGGDFFAWVNAFSNQTPACDVNNDEACDGGDFFAWVNAFSNGC